MVDVNMKKFIGEYKGYKFTELIGLETDREYYCNDCGEFTAHELYEHDKVKEVWECTQCECKDNIVEK